MATTVFAFTDPGVYATGPFVNFGSYVGRVAMLSIAGVEIDVSITGTDATIPINSSSTGLILISVDGAAASALTYTADNAWHTATLFSGLSDTAHTVRLQFTGGVALDKNAFVSVTGAVPAVAYPSGFVANTLLNGNAHLRLDDWASATFASFPVIQASRTDAQVTFRATCDTIKVYTFQAGQRFRLSIDGVDAGTVDVPATSTWGWVTLFSGLSAGAAHLYALTLTSAFNSLGNTVVYALMLLTSVAAGTFDSTYAPATRKRLAAYGDSLTQANFAGTTAQQDSSFGYLHRMGLALDWAVFNRGNSGQSVTTYLRDNTAQVTALSPAPDYVIIWGGVNDLGTAGDGSTPSATFKTDFVSMLNSLLSGTSYPVYVIGIAPHSTRSTVTIAAWNGSGNGIQGAIAACNTPSRVTFIDPTPWQLNGAGGADYTTNYLDGLHFNPTGYGVIEPKLQAVLAPVTTQPIFCE